MYKANRNNEEVDELSSIDLINGINDIMRSAREECLRDYGREEDEKVYFLETRKEHYPLQIIGRIRD